MCVEGKLTPPPLELHLMEEFRLVFFFNINVLLNSQVFKQKLENTSSYILTNVSSSKYSISIITLGQP